jgi:hypothetical protein
MENYRKIIKNVERKSKLGQHLEFNLYILEKRRLGFKPAQEHISHISEITTTR